MFGKKCPRCDKRVRKSYEFCPSCGINFDSGNEEGDSGILGKSDESMDLGLPFGMNMMLKPLIKELGKQMGALDREMQREMKEGKKRPGPNFRIQIMTPNQMPMEINGVRKQQPELKNQPEKIMLPQFSREVLESIKGLQREEPKTDVRRLANEVIYEISIPGVNSLKNISISKLDKALEIKSFSKDKVFVKNIDISLPLINYNFSDEKLVLMFGLK